MSWLRQLNRTEHRTEFQTTFRRNGSVTLRKEMKPFYWLIIPATSILTNRTNRYLNFRLQKKACIDFRLKNNIAINRKRIIINVTKTPIKVPLFESSKKMDVEVRGGFEEGSKFMTTEECRFPYKKEVYLITLT